MQRVLPVDASYLILQLQLGLKSFDWLNLASMCSRVIVLSEGESIPITTYNQEVLKIQIFIVAEDLLEINLRFLARAAMGTCSIAPCSASFNSSAAAHTWIGIKFIAIAVTELYRSLDLPSIVQLS